MRRRVIKNNVECVDVEECGDCAAIVLEAEGSYVSLDRRIERES